MKGPEADQLRVRHILDAMAKIELYLKDPKFPGSRLMDLEIFPFMNTSVLTFKLFGKSPLLICLI